MRRPVLLLIIGLVFLSLMACTLSLQRTPPRKPVVLPTASGRSGDGPAPAATMAPLVPIILPTLPSGPVTLPTVPTGAIQVPAAVGGSGSASGILDQVSTIMPGLPGAAGAADLLGGKTATPTSTATATPTPKR